ncbi:MAG: nucleoside triphosphate pyrophosphatase [Pseudobdellovibrionaceae bacterium]
MKQLILASASPRRLSILKEHGFAPVVLVQEVNEDLRSDLSIDFQMMDLAQRKARAVEGHSQFEKTKDQIILAADTLVIFEGQVLGKPRSELEAFDFLKMLSGSCHQVKTAVCILDWLSQQMVLDIETTNVYFKKLTDAEIRSYIATGEPMDKAGAYGIQGKAAEFVDRIQGSYENVVGLPIELVQKHLANRM